MFPLGDKFTTALGRYHLLLTPPPSRLLLPFSSISHPRHPTELESSLDFLLQQCATPRQAKQIHAQLLTSSAFHHPDSAYLFARLVSVYGRLGLLPDARSVFRAAHDRRSSLLWNSILRANLAHSHSLETLCLYNEMRALGALPDGFTFPLVIRACAALGVPRLCGPVHNHAVSMGFQWHLHVANELMVMYGNIGRMDLARRVFDAMPLRNVVSWNTLISGYSRNYDSEAAHDAFRLMEFTGFEPNPVTWTALLSAHARCQRHDEVIGLFDKMRTKGGKATAQAVAVALSVYPYASSASLQKGKEMHSYAIRSGFEWYSFVKNSLICMYGKLGYREDAERLFLETTVKDLVSWNALISSYAAAGLCGEAYEIFSRMEKTGEFRPNVVSWSAVIGVFASGGMVEQSLDLFRQMQQAGVAPNSITAATVLAACAELSSLRLGKEIHGHAIRGLMDHNLLVANGLLNMYTKSGSLREGQSVFNRMEDKDLISWNSMIAGYGIHGFCDEALGTFSDMVRAGCEPDGITFIAVLSACSRSGHVSQGRRLFVQMVDEYKIQPCMEHYSCMVDLLGRAGLLREASQLMECMPVKPNACVWGALLNSCRIYGNTATAEDTMAQVLGPEGQATGNYMLLSNIYAACGRWEDSARVRVMTKVKGLKKSPGQSWIEVKNNVYVFSAGSSLPPGAEDVYEVLEDLYRHMESDEFALDWPLLQCKL
ncbi:putative pentatricopeptide repeat-containing protein At1g17630 [Phoenix dactylifera]|uniref:Pentatricopeptide repeat-containing protein At1g17630 n=1 Tax=Phoenix dactylifera TaxID=42345 RepID=A0A8B7CTL6_PHODC|nr:putative pentatricopeptide repeat-containing protein At1g17630 [Phoenix dactylifera]